MMSKICNVYIFLFYFQVKVWIHDEQEIVLDLDDIILLRTHGTYLLSKQNDFERHLVWP